MIIEINYDIGDILKNVAVIRTCVCIPTLDHPINM